MEILRQRREKMMTMKVKLEQKIEPINMKPDLDYLHLLPEEVWEMILKKLDDPREILMCSKISPLWENILEWTKPKWLFYKVFPHLVSYLTIKDVLNSRRVCSSWDFSIDLVLRNVQFEEDTNHTTKTSLRSHSLLRKTWGKSFIWFDGCSQLQKFGEVTGNHPQSRNPFVGRRVGFGNKPQNAEEYYWSYVLAMLRVFGGQIWDCHFICEEKPTTFMFILRGCLGRLQNLKRLELTYNSDQASNSPGEDDGEYLGGGGGPLFRGRRFTALRRYLKVKPLPQLPHLKHLRLNKEAPISFYTLVFPSYSEQLEKLELVTGQDSTMVLMGLGDDEPRWRLPCLQEIHVTIQSSHLLQNLVKLNNNMMKKVVLQVLYQEVEFGPFLNVIQCFKETIKVVKLRFKENGNLGAKKPAGFCMDMMTRLELHRIQVLELENPPMSLNYLLCFPTLPMLKLKWAYLSGYDKKSPFFKKCNELVEVQGYIDRMYESRLWKMMPLLKEIYIKGARLRLGRLVEVKYNYNREVYQNYYGSNAYLWKKMGRVCESLVRFVFNDYPGQKNSNLGRIFKFGICLYLILVVAWICVNAAFNFNHSGKA